MRQHLRKGSKTMNGNESAVNRKRNAAAFLIATAGTVCLPQAMNLKENVLGFTNSIFSVFVWLLCLYAVGNALRSIDLQDRRGWSIAAVFGFFLSTAMLFGARLEASGNVNFKDWRLWVSLPVLTCLFTILTRKIWSCLESMNMRRKAAADGTDDGAALKKAAGRRDILVFCCLILCWIPVLLAVYPGFFVYDAWDEWKQAAEWSFNTHHPLLHVLLLGGIVCGVQRATGSYNLGIACYMILQMAAVSCGFTRMLSFMRARKCSGRLRIFSVLYLAFFPVIVMYALCSSKDTLFSTSLLMLMLSMLDLESDEDAFFASFGKAALFVLSAAAAMLLRRNGVYALALLIPFLLIRHRKHFGKMAVLLAAAGLSYFLIDAGVAAALHAEGGESQEILTVPIQQLARTYKFNREVFGPEDTEILHEILPEEALALYMPKLSDPVKVQFRNEAFAADRFRYVKLWARIGLRKPLSYLNAWLANSYGFWYPDTVIDVYSGSRVFTFTYEDSSYFGYEVEKPGVRESRIPWLDRLYRKMSLEISHEKIPVVSMLFSPGGVFWGIAFVFAYVLYRRRYHVVIPCMTALAVWLTVLLGPTYLPRYVLIFWFAAPLFLAMLTEEI